MVDAIKKNLQKDFFHCVEDVLNGFEHNHIHMYAPHPTKTSVNIRSFITVNAQMAWSDELSRYLFVWLTFIAAAYAAGGKAHIGVMFFKERSKPGLMEAAADRKMSAVQPWSISFLPQ